MVMMSKVGTGLKCFVFAGIVDAGAYGTCVHTIVSPSAKWLWLLVFRAVVSGRRLPKALQQSWYIIAKKNGEIHVALHCKAAGRRAGYLCQTVSKIEIGKVGSHHDNLDYGGRTMCQLWPKVEPFKSCTAFLWTCRFCGPLTIKGNSKEPQFTEDFQNKFFP